MEIRKLNTLRKSIGGGLGTKTFVEWLRSEPEKTVGPMVDKTAAVASAVGQLVSDGKVRCIRCGGYVVKRGRGQVILEAATE